MSAEPTSLLVKAEPTPIKDLIEYKYNARLHALDPIVESLATLGQYRPITVNIGTITGRANEVLAGNGTVKAARRLNWELIDAHFVDVDEQTARKINLVDNRAPELSAFDEDALLESIGCLDDLLGSGYDEAWVSKRLTPPEGGDESPQMGDLQFRVVVDCKDEADQVELIASLEAQGRAARPLIS